MCSMKNCQDTSKSNITHMMIFDVQSFPSNSSYTYSRCIKKFFWWGGKKYFMLFSPANFAYIYVVESRRQLFIVEDLFFHAQNYSKNVYFCLCVIIFHCHFCWWSIEREKQKKYLIMCPFDYILCKWGCVYWLCLAYWTQPNWKFYNYPSRQVG